MKIMWNSVAPWIPTGYGQQTAQVVPRLRAAGHDVAISANYGQLGGLGFWGDTLVYPADHTGLQKLALPQHVKHWAGINGWSPDDVLVITLFDVHVWLNSDFGGCLARFHDLNNTAWVPVDHQQLPPLVEKSLKDYGVRRPIAMSRFGHERLLDAGFDPLYVPHGIDTEVYAEKDKLESRALFKIPDDRFVIGMVANNAGNMPSRKAFPEVFEAFARFQKDNPDAFLYLHTDIFGFDRGLNLLSLAARFEIPEDSIQVVDQAHLQIGIPAEMMAHAYSAMDVLVNPSYGEGFGVPIIEAQACGTPVIVNDSTAMPELSGPGWVCEAHDVYDASHAAKWRQPDVDSLVECMGLAMSEASRKRTEARLFALQYDADHVFDAYWVDALEKLDGPREVPALVPVNRAQRRAMRKAAA